MRNKIFFASLLIFSPLSAKEVLKLTFDEAAKLALEKNLEIGASYQNYSASKLDKKASSSAFFPNLSANLNYDKLENTAGNYNASLNLQQNIFNGFRDYANTKTASHNIQIAAANLEETKAQISYDLKTAVANYFFAKDSIKLSMNIKARREDNLKMVELRFENGRENKGSVLLSKAYLEQAKLDQLKAKNAMLTSLVFLKRILNIFDDSEIEITTTADVPDPLEINPDYDALTSQTPTAKKFQAALDNQEAALKISRSHFFPELNLNASLAKLGPSFFPDENKRWSVGATLSWPLFDGGKDFYASQSASLSVKAAEKNLSNQHLELKKILTESFSHFIEAYQTTKVSASFLAAGEIRAEIARSKYNNGLSNFDDWDLIENDLIIKQKDYILQIRNRLEAFASWEKAQGKGVIP